MKYPSSSKLLLKNLKLIEFKVPEICMVVSFHVLSSNDIAHIA